MNDNRVWEAKKLPLGWAVAGPVKKNGKRDKIVVVPTMYPIEEQQAVAEQIVRDHNEAVERRKGKREESHG